jgi:uncharacterized protein YdaU (DUF1376 family)
MANEKLDWFPIYWQRFIIGTLEMNAEEIGAYILLLIHEWDKGFVPTNDKELRKISRLSSKKLVKVLEKFEKVGEKYFNSTLEIIRIEQTEKSNRRSESAKNAARIKYERIANARKSESDPLPLEEKREEEKRIEEKREEKIPPELIFQYMIGDQEILSVEETFKEKFQILFNDLNFKHGGLKIKKWIQEFSELHKQKTWKDDQDFRNHISNFIRVQSEKDNGATKKLNTRQPQSGPISDFGKH